MTPATPSSSSTAMTGKVDCLKSVKTDSPEQVVAWGMAAACVVASEVATAAAAVSVVAAAVSDLVAVVASPDTQLVVPGSTPALLPP